jgi:hypothetical protein
MASEIDNTPVFEAQVLDRLSRIYKTGISIKHKSEELKIDKLTVKRLLKLLGCASAI